MNYHREKHQILSTHYIFFTVLFSWMFHEMLNNNYVFEFGYFSVISHCLIRRYYTFEKSAKCRGRGNISLLLYTVVKENKSVSFYNQKTLNQILILFQNQKKTNKILGIHDIYPLLNSIYRCGDWGSERVNNLCKKHIWSILKQ